MSIEDVTESVVVPGIFVTIETVFFDIQFMKDDFPTLGLPIIANFGISNSSDADSSLKLRINECS